MMSVSSFLSKNFRASVTSAAILIGGTSLANAQAGPTPADIKTENLVEKARQAQKNFAEASEAFAKAQLDLTRHMLDKVEDDLFQNDQQFPASENIRLLQLVLDKANEEFCQIKESKQCALEADGIFGASTGKSLLTLSTFIAKNFPAEPPFLAPEKHSEIINLLDRLGLKKELDAYLDVLDTPAYQTAQEQRRTIENLRQEMKNAEEINDIEKGDLAQELLETARDGVDSCIRLQLQDPYAFIEELAQNEKTPPDAFQLKDLARKALTTACSSFLGLLDKEEAERLLDIATENLHSSITLYMQNQIQEQPPIPSPAPNEEGPLPNPQEAPDRYDNYPIGESEARNEFQAPPHNLPSATFG